MAVRKSPVIYGTLWSRLFNSELIYYSLVNKEFKFSTRKSVDTQTESHGDSRKQFGEQVTFQTVTEILRNTE